MINMLSDYERVLNLLPRHATLLSGDVWEFTPSRIWYISTTLNNKGELPIALGAPQYLYKDGGVGSYSPKAVLNLLRYIAEYGGMDSSGRAMDHCRETWSV